MCKIWGGDSGPPGPHGSGITAFDVLHFLIAISDIDLNWIRILKVPGEFNDSQFINAYLKKKTLGLKLPSYVIHTRTSIYCLKTFPVDFFLNRSYQKTFKELYKEKGYLCYLYTTSFFLIHIESREHFTIELLTDKGLTNHKTTSFWDLLKTSRPWKLELQLTKCLRNFFLPFLYPLMQQILTLPNLQNRSCWTSEVGNMKCCARIWPTSQVGCFKFLK